MKQRKLYSYYQRTASASPTFEQIYKEFLELNLAKEHLVDLYIHVCEHKNNPALQLTPFQRKDASIMEVNFRRYYQIVVNILRNLKQINPVAFMEHFDEYFNGRNNCTAVENGVVYEHFLAASGKANRLVVIDPNPFLVEEISSIEDDTLRNQITLAFKNPRHVSVYKTADELRGINICLLCELIFTKDDVVRVLHFERSDNQKSCKEEKQNALLKELKTLKSSLTNANRWKLFSLIPTAMLESSKSTNSLRKQAMEQFALEKIYLIDSKAVKIPGYSKLCLVTLSHMPQIADVEDLHHQLAKRNVFLQRCDLVEERMAQQPVESPVSSDNNSGRECELESDAPVRMTLVDQDEYRIGAGEFYSGSSTLHQIYNSLRASNRISKGRARGKDYRVSVEVKLRYSGKPSEDGKIQPRIIFQGYVNRNNCEKYKEKKRELHYQEQNKGYASEDKMYSHMESIVLDDPTLHPMIVKSIAAEYGKKPISLKTFCILHIKKLREKTFYEDVYKTVFAAPNSAENPICSLIIGKITVETIKNAVAETAKTYNLKEGEVENLWRQLYVIFSIAIDEGFLKENPVLDIIHEMDEQEDEIKYFKKYMTEKTLTEAQETALLEDLLTAEEFGFVVGMLIKFFSGLTYSEICALTWKDYAKLSDYDCALLHVHKRFEDKKTIAIQHLSTQKNRIVPLTKYIVPMLKEWKKRTDKLFKHYKLEKSVADSKPIVYRVAEPLVPVTPDALRNFGNKFYKKHGPQGHELSHADGHGGKKQYDTSSYAGDKFCENFYYQGLHEAGLDEGELCFLLGIHAAGTLEENYAGYEKPSHLLKMRDKLDVWAAKRIGNLSCLDRKTTRFTLSQKQRTFISQPTVIPMEMMFEMKIKEDSPDVLFELFNRLGFDVYCEWE